MDVVKKTAGLTAPQIKEKFPLKESALASLVPMAALASTLPLVAVLGNCVNKLSSLPADQVELLRTTSERLVGTSSMYQKNGLRLVRIAENFDVEQIKDASPALKTTIQEVAKGENAFFVADESALKALSNFFQQEMKQAIIVPEKKLQLLNFHEFGHALNHNGSKVLKFLQKVGVFTKFVPAMVTTFCAFTVTKKSDNKTDKVINFVRENAGKLALLCFSPILIEEFIASYRSQAVANSSLPKELAKKVFKSNVVGYLHYALTAALFVVSAWGTVKVKDKLVEQK